MAFQTVLYLWLLIPLSLSSATENCIFSPLPNTAELLHLWLLRCWLLPRWRSTPQLTIPSSYLYPQLPLHSSAHLALPSEIYPIATTTTKALTSSCPPHRIPSPWKILWVIYLIICVFGIQFSRSFPIVLSVNWHFFMRNTLAEELFGVAIHFRWRICYLESRQRQCACAMFTLLDAYSNLPREAAEIWQRRVLTTPK